MGKRSDFERVERDFYPTPEAAVAPLVPHLETNINYYEPCVGAGDLVRHISKLCPTARCIGSSDYEVDATCSSYSTENLDYFITNPPWNRNILHAMITNLSEQCSTWLLFDADWMHTKQSAPYMRFCAKIVSVGRVKWIPNSKMTGKDNCAWYLFVPYPVDVTIFVGREYVDEN